MDVSDDESDNNENKDENKDDELEKIEEADEVYSLNSSVETRSNMFEEEETKSRFTQYSKSSSAVPRNEHLRLLDAKFEKVYISIFENIRHYYLYLVIFSFSIT